MDRTRRLAAVVAIAASAAACSRESPNAPAGSSRTPAKIRLATTTSARDSGLLDALLPAFRKKTGDQVDVVAVGTGAAFKLAADGNADLVLVNDEKSEQEFIAAGNGR